MRVAAYARVSTHEQAQEGFSIHAQRERLQAFCVSQGWEIVEEYIEEGRSAKDLDRPKMKKLLNDIKKGHIDIILVYRLDRLTRSVLDLYQLLQIFERHDVSFKSATEVYDTSTAMGRLFITLVAALAQWERENLAERVVFGMEQMVHEGMKPGGHSPFGYHFDKHFHCTILENEAKTVQRIFEWYANGLGYRAIAGRLNQLKIKPKIAKHWNPNSIRDILLNDMYIGIYRWGEIIKHQNHPPLIPEQLYHLVQKRIASKTASREGTGKYPLTGILRCGSCNEHSMQGYHDKREGKSYYRCTICKKTTWDKRILDPILEEVERLIPAHDLMGRSQQTATGTKEQELKEKIKKIHAQKERWYDLFTADNNPIPKEVLFSKINQLTEKEDALSLQLERATNAHDINDPMHLTKTTIRENYCKADAFRQKELLHSIFDKIIITRERGKNQPLSIAYRLK
ncbi:recombinase family protein [Peribacillus muralis]|uniref:recombinase family protein n=1 Tax=Peribacillus muralis TaxID=264697 RepID=UPI003D0315CD